MAALSVQVVLYGGIGAVWQTPGSPPMGASSWLFTVIVIVAWASAEKSANPTAAAKSLIPVSQMDLFTSARAGMKALEAL
jgi:hypothetical protein